MTNSECNQIRRIVLYKTSGLEDASESVCNKEFTEVIKSLLTRLSDWIEQWKSRISFACLHFRSDGLVFLVMQSGILYDDVLNDQITDLDIEIARNEQFAVVRLDVACIPKIDTSEYSTDLYLRCMEDC